MLERSARAIVHSVLRRLRAGRLELTENWSGERLAFGPPNARLRAEIALQTPEFYPRLVRGRSVALGETYAEEMWEVDDLLALCRMGARDIGRADRLRRRAAPLLRPIQRLASARARNTRRGARRNIAAHYDLGNDMFELFLDRKAMMYSAALFEHEEMTLEQAQEAKLERICSKLELGPGDHLLEIGSGWGGLAVHAASRYGCRVTSTTISAEQRAYAERRVMEAGLADRIRILGADYRDLEGTYDKLVSIEMIEAVGWEYFDLFFRRCSELLGPDGLFFLQAIAIDDRAYEAEKSAASFSNQLIFPGGCLPSLERMQRSVAGATDMRTVWLEDISPSYAQTLRHWRERFLAAVPRLGELGYDRRFRRLWEIWLALSEAGFREARIMDLQLLFAKPGQVAPGPVAAEGERAVEPAAA